ncbi:DNA helicase [Platysternon megacephalum]|uniref:DNA helicase n=1 Tax=Platysternon megacephalum TaxID=55544 RepID=A0A4D9DJR2_9SAUR|nr:DNA helicase [Platysternon megacephalum]
MAPCPSPTQIALAPELVYCRLPDPRAPQTKGPSYKWLCREGRSGSGRADCISAPELPSLVSQEGLCARLRLEEALGAALFLEQKGPLFAVPDFGLFQASERQGQHKPKNNIPVSAGRISGICRWDSLPKPSPRNNPAIHAVGEALVGQERGMLRHKPPPPKFSSPLPSDRGHDITSCPPALAPIPGGFLVPGVC